MKAYSCECCHREHQLSRLAQFLNSSKASRSFGNHGYLRPATTTLERQQALYPIHRGFTNFFHNRHKVSMNIDINRGPLKDLNMLYSECHVVIGGAVEDHTLCPETSKAGMITVRECYVFHP
ncbi:hypothetical protein PS1_038096 [Malus domestica]